MKPALSFARLAVVTLFAALGSSSVSAQVYDSRQYYSEWSTQTTTTTTSYYRNYYYKPYADYSGYDHHQVYYYPQQPDYFYYYNPQTKLYWGRTPVNRGGKELYSMLEQKDRKPKLEDIPEEAFPKPSTPPPIPGAKDKIQMKMPPQDLPKIKK